MRAIRIIVSGVLASAITASALAQDSTQKSGEENEKLLGGPDVKDDDSASPLPPDFSGSNQRAAAVISAEVWMRALRALELTEEQRGAIDAIEQEVRAQTLEFRQTYGEELREIERARREAQQRGERPPPDMLLRYAEINKHAPSPVEAQEKIWALLTEVQQDAMSARLEEVQQRMIEERRRRAQGQAETDQPMDAMSMEGTAPDGERTSPDEAIDEAGKRRLAFLRSRQLSRPAGAPPSERERRFRFDD
jgi:hypothetical protein